MEPMRARFAVNAAEVASKVIDGEAIAIHLTTGAYYSLDGAAGRIWALLEQRSAIADVARVLTKDYDLDAAVSEADLERFLGQLREEGLIVETTEPAGAVQPMGGVRRPWVSPVLNIYRDMADMLALDPPVPGLELAERDDGTGSSGR